MRQKGFAPMVILVGVLILALTAGGIFYFSRSIFNQKLPQATPKSSVNPVVTFQTPQPIPVATSTASVSANEIANWNIVINRSFAYSIQYPKDWITAKAMENSPLVLLTNSVSQIPTDQDISVGIMVKDTDQSFSQYLDSFLPEASWKKTTEDITINGIKGIKWVLENPYDVNNSQLAEVAFFPRQGKDALFVYSIRIYGPKSASDITNQILSTFKGLQ